MRTLCKAVVKGSHLADAAIQVEGLGKRYHIGAAQRERTASQFFRDLLMAPIDRIRRFGRSSHREEDTIWALRDVSFEVPRGEVLGVIGQNGAGKSTLLKLLTRITEPTTGRAVIRGRVGSLLEVGTGFHPELTGRENIYLSGAMLGMKNREIREQFDEIVDFSGVSKFLDTPIKRYSSGMRVRLGFAVAAHLDPEILLIDEVLAVGDAEFQRRCLGKMEGLTSQGRTILFVSHNMPSIEALCDRAILLEDGQITMEDEPRAVTQKYLSPQDSLLSAEVDLSDHPLRDDGSVPALEALRLRTSEGLSPHVPVGSGLTMEVEVGRRVQGMACPTMHIHVLSTAGESICHFISDKMGFVPAPMQAGDCFRCHWNKVNVTPGEYMLNLQLNNHGVSEDRIYRAARIEVTEADFYGTGKVHGASAAFLPEGRWDVRKGGSHDA